MMQLEPPGTLIFAMLILLFGCSGNRAGNNYDSKKMLRKPPMHGGRSQGQPSKSEDRLPKVYITPLPHGYVNDYEDLFTAADEKWLEGILRQYDTAQIAIVTLDSTYFKRDDFESYSLNLFNSWGVGDSVTNNGILVLISRGARLMRIENGLGIEKFVSNERTKQIIDSAILPHFSEDKYYEGVLNGILEIKKVVTESAAKNG